MMESRTFQISCRYFILKSLQVVLFFWAHLFRYFYLVFIWKILCLTMRKQYYSYNITKINTAIKNIISFVKCNNTLWFFLFQWERKEYFIYDSNLNLKIYRLERIGFTIKTLLFVKLKRKLLKISGNRKLTVKHLILWYLLYRNRGFGN